jgi:hypothetical protein
MASAASAASVVNLANVASATNLSDVLSHSTVAAGTFLAADSADDDGAGTSRRRHVAGNAARHG